MPSNLQLELDYTKYVQGQMAIRFNYIDEKKAIITMPFHRKKFSAFSRLTIKEVTVPKNKFTNAELLVSSVIKGVSSNLTTNALFTDPKHPFIYSTLFLTFRLPSGIRLTPQTQYEYGANRVSMVKLELEKSLLNNGYLNLSYENLIPAKTTYISVGLRYNFSFAQTSFTAKHGNHSLITTQSARGSLVFDDQTDYLSVNNQSNLGKGGIIISPFLDVNCNGLRDFNEPKVAGLNLHVNGGRFKNNIIDTTISIVGLEAYTNYYVELDKNSFENIAWQIKKKIINVAVDPNKFKFIEVPVSVMGEVSGTVYLSNNKGKNGISRIIVNIYDKENKLVAHTLSEGDGYFSFLGLPPGKYTAAISDEQLRDLNMATVPPTKKAFTIVPNKDGDVVDGLEFVLRDQDQYVKQ